MAYSKKAKEEKQFAAEKTADVKSRAQEKSDETRQKEQDALPKVDIDNPKHGNKHYNEL